MNFQQIALFGFLSFPLLYSAEAQALSGTLIFPDRTIVKNCSVQVRDGVNSEVAYCGSDGTFRLYQQPSASAVITVRPGMPNAAEFTLPGTYFSTDEQIIVVPYVSKSEDPQVKNREDRVELYKKAIKTKDFSEIERNKMDPAKLKEFKTTPKDKALAVKKSDHKPKKGNETHVTILKQKVEAQLREFKAARAKLPSNFR